MNVKENFEVYMKVVKMGILVKICFYLVGKWLVLDIGKKMWWWWVGMFIRVWWLLLIVIFVFVIFGVGI